MYTYYKIKEDKQNTGVVKVRIAKKYITCKLSTTYPTEYSQEYLKRLYAYDEMKEYIEEYTSELSLDDIRRLEFYNNLPENVVLITSNELSNTNNNEIYNNKEDALETKKLEDMTLSELRKLYPNIKAVSKAIFIKKINEM